MLDTNVLIHDPSALYQFEEHEVVIPMTVLEELDKIKQRVLLKEQPSSGRRGPWRKLVVGLVLFNLAALVAAYFLSPGFAALVNDWFSRLAG